MIPELPSYVPAVFMIAVIFTFWFFYKAARNSKVLAVVMLSWLIIQGAVAMSEFYLTTNTVPPRFALAVGPAIVAILILFLIPSGRRWIRNLDLKYLTWVHSVRIPVELVLYWLFLSALVPEIMTFSGRNFDILAGLTAPLMIYFTFTKNIIGRNGLLAWNIICLLLLGNIVFTAALSAPSVFQQFAFEQPNVAILIFPYVWLPSFIVPIVLLSHLAAITQLTKKVSNENG
jgi:hypothetical protein